MRWLLVKLTPRNPRRWNRNLSRQKKLSDITSARRWAGQLGDRWCKGRRRPLRNETLYSLLANAKAGNSQGPGVRQGVWGLNRCTLHFCVKQLGIVRCNDAEVSAQTRLVAERPPSSSTSTHHPSLFCSPQRPQHTHTNFLPRPPPE